MGNFGGNGLQGRSKTHAFSATNHKETITTASRRDTGDTWGGSSMGSGGNAVGEHLHRETTGNRTSGIVRTPSVLTIMQFKSPLDQSEMDCSRLYEN